MSCHSGGPGQTLFLGASIADFNLNMGWGGQPSQLTVTLIEDRCPGSSGGENGSTTASSGAPAKYFYNTDVNSGIVSGIHYGNDPGFFGVGNDIINAAYLFKIGGVEFIGVVRSWEKSTSSAGIIYTVTMDSADYILDHAYVICNKYTGTIFTKIDNEGVLYGGPYNYTGSSTEKYKGTFEQGAFPNVFNAYGFLESGGFGGSGRNDRGVPANLIVDALTILTSTQEAKNAPVAFSPFGRIILKSGTGAGSIYKSFDANEVNRCCCVLDMSELPRTPSDFRISADVVTINELVSTIADAVGVDFYWQTMLYIEPAEAGAGGDPSKPYIVLKLKVRDRTEQLDPNFLRDQLSSGNISDASSITVGKEKNNVTNRTMIIGANQQRLYQAASRRLSYGQSNYIWHPVSGTFIDYKTYNRGWAKLPAGLSIRNPYLTQSASSYNTIVTSQQLIQDNYTNFDTYGNYVDLKDTWDPSAVTAAGGLASAVINPPPANDAFSAVFPAPDGVRSGWSATVARYIPLYWDMIFPFFGFVGREESTPEADSTSINPNYNKIRPCFMDCWTNNIVIPVYADELPSNLQADFSGSFLVTESEIRAATAGWESYLTYCMTKVYKPDLYRALISWYKGNLTTLNASNSIGDKANNNTPNSAEHDQDLTGNINVANNLGYIAGGGGTPNPQMSIDLSFIINPDLLRDFIKISEYVAGFSKYYGKSYMVRLPKVDGYRDMSNSSFSVSDAYTGPIDYEGDVVGYSGSGKTFYSYEPASDGGWEEYGNYINNDIVVGSAKWYALINEDGKIPPLLAYNAGTSVDWIQKAICNFTTNTDIYLPNLTALHNLLGNAFVADTRTLQGGPGPTGVMNTPPPPTSTPGQ
jgi:hypothetical protein